MKEDIFGFTKKEFEIVIEAYENKSKLRVSKDILVDFLDTSGLKIKIDPKNNKILKISQIFKENEKEMFENAVASFKENLKLENDNIYKEKNIDSIFNLF